ncbi:MAG: hypothetical protein MUE53_00885 [Chitinophagales bacterium]|jgi:hypothetical protein|nr:hypothetical protein [Chitinophagales bacterium]
MKTFSILFSTVVLFALTSCEQKPAETAPTIDQAIDSMSKVIEQTTDTANKMVDTAKSAATPQSGK